MGGRQRVHPKSGSPVDYEAITITVNALHQVDLPSGTQEDSVLVLLI